MSSVVISGDTSGTVSLTVPSVAGTNTATLPAATGTVMVSGNMPAFSAYQSGTGQSLSASTWTLLQFATKEFDTNTCFNNTSSTATLNGLSVPAWAFMPPVAGYYQISGSYNTQAAASYEQLLAIYKNGSSFKYICDIIPSTVRSCAGSGLIYMNGSTDYIQLYCLVTSSAGINNNSLNTYFQAVMVRAA
jgi:hypothetical protein